MPPTTVEQCLSATVLYKCLRTCPRYDIWSAQNLGMSTTVSTLLSALSVHKSYLSASDAHCQVLAKVFVANSCSSNRRKANFHTKKWTWLMAALDNWATMQKQRVVCQLKIETFYEKRVTKDKCNRPINLDSLHAEIFYLIQPITFLNIVTVSMTGENLCFRFNFQK